MLEEKNAHSLLFNLVVNREEYLLEHLSHLFPSFPKTLDLIT